MKVLVVQDTDWLARGPHQQHHLMERLALKGHEIHVIDYELLWRVQGTKELYSKRQVFHNTSQIYQGAEITLIRPGIIKLPWLDYLSLLFTHKKEIDRQIKEFPPDIIVGLGILSTYLAVRAAKRSAIPFIYYWIDVLHRLVPSRVFQPVARVLESIALKQADVILVINEELKNCVANIGAPPQRTFILRAGIDTERFSPKVNGSAVRREYGLKDDDIILLFMGWLYHFSGLKEVVKQMARTNDTRLKLLVVGEGDAYEELTQMKHRYNLQGRVILTGKKPYHEIPAFIAASDICLLPAYTTEKIMRDIVPIKMYEYMAMAKPVIATRLPGVMKEFGDGNGIIYVARPEDVPEKAIQLVAEGNLSELGAKARSFVERNSWDNITNEFERTIREAIQEKQK
ncbi:MAG TPA: glycosyltransferase [Dehalococcoidia bacterium]|nr:glycosyltransferase [Dehalococcoidia bacterium]